MLGLITLALTAFMIYNLVKNALVGKQLDSKDNFDGTIELLLPISQTSEFYLEPWVQSLSHFKTLQGHIKIHVLLEGDHPSMSQWQQVHERFPFVEVHSFLMRPAEAIAIPWMIDQMSAKVQGQVVIIGDSELVPTEAAFLSLAKMVQDKKKPVFVLPQTAKLNILGEAVAVLNPTLALASVFGFRKLRRNLSHPLISIAEGWMGMSLEEFKTLNFARIKRPYWKEALSFQWEIEKRDYVLAFGEKHLLRYYPEHFPTQMLQMKKNWNDLWLNGDRKGFFYFLVVLFIWSFPILFLLTHPFWSMASIMLLILYRFFSKIVFQESWIAFFLHHAGCVMWIVTLGMWLFDTLQSRYGTEGRKKFNS